MTRMTEIIFRKTASSCFILCFLFCVSTSFSQYGDDSDLEGDEAWDLENLDPNDIKPDSTEYKSGYYNSSGWFPSPLIGSAYIAPAFWGSTVYNPSGSVTAFGPLEGLGTVFNHSSRYPISEEEVSRREIMEPLNASANTEGTNDFGPIEGAWNLGMELGIGTGLPAVLRLLGGYNYQNHVLYSRDQNQFRDRNTREIRSFDEATYMVLDREGWYYGAGLNIPIYGSFVRFMDFYAGMSVDLEVDYTLFQQRAMGIWGYSQIETDKNRIRYGNGIDTLGLGFSNQSDNIVQNSGFISARIKDTNYIGPIYFSFWAGLAFLRPNMIKSGGNWSYYDLNFGLAVGYAFGS
ncbi:MAG: hypothetical protein Kapaf2KO_01350 [Candidatus Kapaibacteriales bacterium]